MSQLLGVIVGFILGLIGSLFHDSCRRRRDKKDFARGLMNELKGIASNRIRYDFSTSFYDATSYRLPLLKDETQNQLGKHISKSKE